MKAKLVLVVSVLVVVSSMSVISQDHKTMRMGPPDGRTRFLDELKLTDDQKKEVEKLRFDLQKQLITQRSKAETARLEYGQLLRADNPDKASIEKKLGEMTQLGAQTKSMMLNQWFSVNKLLNADQQKVWKKALAMRGSRESRMRMPRGRQFQPRPMMRERMMHREM